MRDDRHQVTGGLGQAPDKRRVACETGASSYRVWRTVLSWDEINGWREGEREEGDGR